MEDHNKTENKSDHKTESIDRQNRNQETDKKPTQGSQDIHQQQQGQTGSVQPNDVNQGQKDHKDQKDKKTA